MPQRPIIFIVDDEAHVLSAVERDVRARYASKYRTLKASSGESALEMLTALKARQEQVALMISDQRMPAMEGTELLAQACKIYSEARRVLLTAYADTQAAIASINQVGLDHYLVKPWDDPDVRWAISYFIDRQQIIDVSWAGAGTLWPVPMPSYPPLRPYVDSIKDLLQKHDTLAFDPAKGTVEPLSHAWSIGVLLHACEELLE